MKTSSRSEVTRIIHQWYTNNDCENCCDYRYNNNCKKCETNYCFYPSPQYYDELIDRIMKWKEEYNNND